jgi:FSR family fosmidomycin resistance protein-like MFS transporter
LVPKPFEFTCCQKIANEEDIVPFRRENTNFNRRVTAFNFSKFFYMSSMSRLLYILFNEKFGLSIQESQFHLFVFLAAVAAGTLIGGPLGDRFGNTSFGFQFWELPFTLLLPYANLFWTGILSVL